MPSLLMSGVKGESGLRAQRAGFIAPAWKGVGGCLRGSALPIDPCIPQHWPNYAIRFRYHSAAYDIAVENPRSVCRGVMLAELEGEPFVSSASIALAEDGAVHQIRIVRG